MVAKDGGSIIFYEGTRASELHSSIHDLIQVKDLKITGSASVINAGNFEMRCGNKAQVLLQNLTVDGSKSVSGPSFAGFDRCRDSETSPGILISSSRITNSISLFGEGTLTLKDSSLKISNSSF